MVRIMGYECSVRIGSIWIEEKALIVFSKPNIFSNADVSTPPGSIVKVFAESCWSSLPFIRERPV